MSLLPVRISPDPLVHSTIELRFEPLLAFPQAFSRLYEQLHGRFPELTPLAPATESEAMPAYAPQYHLASSDFVVYVGPQMLAVGARGSYPGWANLRATVAEVVAAAQAAQVIGQPTRLSARYVSFFAGNIVPALTLRLQVPGYEAATHPVNVQVHVPAGNCQNILSVLTPVSRAMLLGQPETEDTLGTVIDIDTRLTALPPNLLAELSGQLEAVHAAEKELFFSLLTEPLLSSLHPEYA